MVKLISSTNVPSFLLAVYDHITNTTPNTVTKNYKSLAIANSNKNDPTPIIDIQLTQVTTNNTTK